ncbi:MAG: response regulator [Bacteriovoracaceae bacterium]|jgi:CheY-like chemotaxis protein/HPt (histidine-containing phosphotransfer) domain-containing protein|nr:response regulator [Bacteriovoracaceae bacterium]
MDEFEKEYKMDALEEIQDNLSSFNDIIRDLESGQDFYELYDELFRLVHNIKGNSKSAGFEELSRIVHLLEEKLIPFRENKIELSDDRLNILGMCYSSFCDWIDMLKEDLNHKIDGSIVERQLDGFAKESQNKLNFLVVDDEVEILEIVTLQLQNIYDCNVSVAYDGKEAVELCEKNKFDLIVTDFNMPVMTGLDFLKNIRLLGEKNKETPVLFISGYHPDFTPSEEIWNKVFILKKPFTQKEFSFLIKCSLINNKNVA